MIKSDYSYLRKLTHITIMAKSKKEKPIDQLDIYIEVQNLWKLLYNIRAKLHKNDRAALYPLLLTQCAKVSADIARTRRCRDREYEYLQEMIGDFEELKMALRNMIQLGIITIDSDKVALFTSIASIDRNLDKWYGYRSDQLNKKLMENKSICSNNLDL